MNFMNPMPSSIPGMGFMNMLGMNTQAMPGMPNMFGMNMPMMMQHMMMPGMSMQNMQQTQHPLYPQQHTAPPQAPPPAPALEHKPPDPSSK